MTRVGGDFMHGRLLLPTVFGALLPVAVMPVRHRASWLAAGACGVWAVVCALALRVPYGVAEDAGIGDERAISVAHARIPHPIRAADMQTWTWLRLGQHYRSQVGAQRTLVYFRQETAGPLRFFRLPLASWVPSPLAGACRGIGRCAFVAGDNVHVIDPHGLAEPMAARLELTHRGIPGHEK